LTKSLQAELGVTVLFSAHELNPLLGAVDRVLYLGRGQAALGTVDEVIRRPVLSRLYGADIDVIRVKGRILVMSEWSAVHGPLLAALNDVVCAADAVKPAPSPLGRGALLHSLWYRRQYGRGYDQLGSGFVCEN
jgi:hypothetical protein